MNAIVAVDQNWAIGKGGDQLCYLSADLKRFKELTLGHPVILGRKTLRTFPGGRPLKGRSNLILSRTPGFRVIGSQSNRIPGKPYNRVYKTLQNLLRYAPEDSFVIGGESVYRALLDHCDTVYVTKIAHSFPADVWFPDLDKDPAWQVAHEEAPLEEKGLTFRYVTYERVR